MSKVVRIATVLLASMVTTSQVGAAPATNILSGHIAGTFVVSYLKTPATGSTAYCSITVNLFDSAGFASSTASGTAAVSGSSATCVVNGGYTFRVGIPATATVSISYNVFLVPPGTPAGALLTPGAFSYLSQMYDQSAPLPANGGWINIGTQYLYQ